MIDTHEIEPRLRVNQADLRVKRTRKLLKDAFMELWRERSFDSITVQDIADRAMVNRTTFYLHFQDKYTLFDQAGRDRFQQFVAMRLPEPGNFSSSGLRSLILITIGELERISTHVCRGTRCGPDTRSLVLASVQGGLHDYIDGWLRRLPWYYDRSPETIEAVAASLSGAIFTAGMTWVRGSTLSAEQMADEVAGLLIAGLSSRLASSRPWEGAPIRSGMNACN